MKYKSELIKDIVEARGHEKSSLHYESECIEKWIEETKGAYPKLCDYQSEWLNYMNENPIGNFPYEIITDVTEATVNNVVPYAYRSAILKGNTLVNIFNNWVNNVGTLTPVQTQDGYFLFTGSNKYARVNLDDIPIFERGVEYTFIYRIKNSTYDGKNNNILRLDVGATTYIQANEVTNGVWKIKKSFSTDETNCFVKVVSWLSSTGSAEVSLQIIEGDYTNVDVPYFEGMQSVKMPVLTTSNEDGTKTNILSTTSDLELRGIGVVQDTLDCLTGEVTERIGEIVLDGSESWNALKDGELTNSFYLNFNNIAINSIITVNSSVFKPVTYSSLYNGDDECISNHNSKSRICVRINKSKLSSSDVNGFKLWLQSNPLKVQYLLTEKSIKTVDLTVTDQDGNTTSIIRPIEGTMHLMTEGDTIKPLFSGEIPVEAITQNLASFIKEE